MDIYTDMHGTKVSRLGVGCSNFGKRIDADTSGEVVNAALDAGLNFFDVADVYGDGTAESILGQALRGRRDQAVVATKFGHATKRDDVPPERRGGHPANVVRSAEESLRAFGSDYIDLFQLHEPDPAVPVEDTLGALDELVRAGKVRWAGCSNFSAEQIRAADDVARSRQTARFETAQNEYSVLVRNVEATVLPCCRELGMRFIPYFPLASGILTGKYRWDERPPTDSRVARMKPDKLFRFFTPRALDIVQRLEEFGQVRGRTVLELAIGFLLAEPAILSIISGAMSAAQVKSNTAACVELTADELAFVRSVSAPGSENGR
jgi:aryl-alcohol dehydrogenase-like predicted oxidoreductase